MFCFFLGRAPKNLELVWNHLYLSICLFLFLSLALSYLSTDYILIISKMWITSITIALVSCCIGSLLDAFPVGLDKDVSGMRRSVTQQIYLKNLPSIKSGSVGQQITTIPKNSISIKVRCPPWIRHKPHVGLQMVYKRPSMKSDLYFCIIFGRFVHRPHLTKISISNNTWVLPLNIYWYIFIYVIISVYRK